MPKLKAPKKENKLVSPNGCERDPVTGQFLRGHSVAAVRQTRALLAVNKLTDEQINVLISSLYKAATQDADTVAARVLLDYLDRRVPKSLQLQLASPKDIGESMITVIDNVATDEIESDRGTALVNMMSKKLETINVVKIAEDVSMLKSLSREKHN